jgi:hypothetical protein
MTIVQALAALGFTDSTDLGSKNGKTLVKVRTSLGWAYERFASVEEAETWARGRSPA